MAEKAEKVEKAAKPAKTTKKGFSKKRWLELGKYNPDLINAYLKDDKLYTKKQVEGLIYPQKEAETC